MKTDLFQSCGHCWVFQFCRHTEYNFSYCSWDPQSWIFTEKTDAEAEIPVLWPPDAKNWLIGKDPDGGKDWRQEKGTTEDEMVGWHHQLDGQAPRVEFEQPLGVGDGQEGLACFSPWSHKELDTKVDWTELNWTECTTLTASYFRIWKSSPGIPSPRLALFVVMLPNTHLTSCFRMSDSL